MEQPSKTTGTILPGDRHCESPTSSVSESRRPISLDGASAWRDQAPELTFSHVEDSNDKAQSLSRISEAENSSTCHDGGDSAHLRSSLGPFLPDTDIWPTLNTDELLTEIGTGVNSRDPRLEFSDIPFVKTQDKTLEDQLRHAIRKNSRHSGEKFIPIGDFDKIVTRESVRKAVQSWLPEDRNLEIWVRAIWDTFDYDDHTTTKRKAFTSRRKIFAILALFNAQTKIASFIRERLWDKDLPFMQNEENKWVYHPRKSQNGTCFVESLNQLEVHDADSFDNYQWFMLSPIFNMAEDRVIHYDLQSRIILPFLEQERGHNPALIGGQGEVSRVKMHRSHHILPKSMTEPPEYLAIKQLMSPDKGQFNAEVESLKRFSNDDHPHLIKLLATYHHKDKFHLIFPWADGNLRDLWRRYPNPIQNYSTARWIADQCRGIATGLRMIHNNEFDPNKTSSWPNKKKMGRHGDMKPENILWFKGPARDGLFEKDVLKISDFGLTRWHGNTSNDKTDIHRLAVSRSYRAPEYDLDRPVSQSWDIWSLACLYLEFITWYLRGWSEGVDEFSKDRAKENSLLTREGTYAISEDDFFNLIMKARPEFGSNTKYEASLKRSVISWINKLHATSGCSSFIHEFLDLISDHMLRIGSEKRTKCDNIADVLDTLYHKCQNADYCSKSRPSPRKKRRNDSDPSDSHDAAIIEFSEETSKRLSQRISLDSAARASNDYHDRAVETEFNGLYPIGDEHGSSIKDSNEQSASSGRVGSQLPINPTLRTYSTKSNSTLLPPTVTTDKTEHPSQQTLSDDSRQSQDPIPTNNHPNMDSISHKPPATNQVQTNSSLTPTGNYTGDTLANKDRASSQDTRGNSQENTGKNGEEPTSRWKRFLGWIKSMACLIGRTTDR